MEQIDWQQLGFWQLFTAGTVSRLLLYFSFAGIAFIVVWKRRRVLLDRFRIYKKLPDAASMHHEVRSSLRTILIWTVMSLPVVWLIKTGRAPLYTDVSEHGWPYYFLTLFGCIAFHDTWFYWTHRWMHQPIIFKAFHAGHHRSTSPSPWAIFSFQSLEAVVQFAVIYPILLVPQHTSVLFIWNLWMAGFNVVGHLGYDFFPRGFTRFPVARELNTTVHHAMHHRHVVYNFGLYFTFWDRVMGTMHPRYHETFEAIKVDGQKL